MKNTNLKRQSWETVTYTDNPDLPDIKDLVEVSAGFLPRPDELVMKKPAKKVTLLLDEDSIDFFKREATRLKTSYQGMIRVLLQKYVSHAKQ